MEKERYWGNVVTHRAISKSVVKQLVVCDGSLLGKQTSGHVEA